MIATALLVLGISCVPALAATETVGLDPLLNILDEIQHKYVDESKIGTPRLLAKAEEGVVDSLDEESYILPEGPLPGEAGPGLAAATRDGGALVVDVIEGGPAEKAGVRTGDRLLRVNGEPAAGRKQPELDRALLGAAGTSVWLLWEDADGEYREAQVERAAVARPAWRRVTLPRGDVIQVFRLDEAAGAGIRAVLAAGPGGPGLVLDLRACTAGDPDAALALAEACLPAGALLATGRGPGGAARRYEVTRKSPPLPTALALLIGPGTRGPAEILAAALTGAGRAVAVGRRTFGFAGRQREFALGGDGKRRVRLTVERFFSPGDVSLTGTGVGADLPSPPGLPREVVRVLERHGIPGRIVDRLVASPPAEYDAAALARGELKLTLTVSGGKSVAEQRGEFEQAFQIVADAVARDAGADLPRDAFDQARLQLISRVRVLLARRQMKPEDALAAALREDPDIQLGVDVLAALKRLVPGAKGKGS